MANATALAGRARFFFPRLRGDRKSYLSWVPLVHFNEFPEGYTRLSTFSKSLRTPTDGKTAETACWCARRRRSVPGFSPSIARNWAAPCVGLRNPAVHSAPSHGGAGLSDGSRAFLPAGTRAVQYPYKVADGMVTLQAANADSGSPNPLSCAKRRRAVGTERLFSIESTFSASTKRMLFLEDKDMGVIGTNRGNGLIVPPAPR